VLVTGGLGFIGSHTVDRLVEKGYNVVSLDSLDKQVHGRKHPSYMNRKARYMKGNIGSRSTLTSALHDVDYVIHLAASVGIGQSFWKVREYMSVNVVGTATLFDILLKETKISKKIKKVIVASSKSIYGEGAYKCPTHGIIYPDMRPIEQLRKKEWEVKCPECSRNAKPVGITEDKPVQNLNPYALSKYATERLALDYAFVTGIPTVAFRYFNVYGPRQSLRNPYTGVLAIFLSRMKNKNPPVVFEDGHQLRDFVYVKDVAGINCQALESKAEGYFNVGTGKPSSLLKTLKFLSELTGSKVKPNITGEFRPGDNRHDFANISKLRKAFGFRSPTSLEKGLSDLCEWSKNADAVDQFEKEEEERKRFLG
jgi:dTDP-L-rhamnose 4-epimerase